MWPKNEVMRAAILKGKVLPEVFSLCLFHQKDFLNIVRP